MLRLASEKVILDDSMEAVNSYFCDMGWSDGLPVIPPTEEAVARMLSGTRRDPASLVAAIPPNWGEATVEKIAINAVMAGCLPEYMPVIITAVEAMSEESFNLSGILATTHPCSPLLIVNGPITKKLNINGKSGAFGPGWRSNATIGRAIRLIMLNIGGAYPGKTAMSTQGQPSRYTYCIAENEDESPWEPLHVERGFKTTDSTVTVSGAENPHNINDNSGLTAEDILTSAVSAMATMTNNNILFQMGNPMLALGPQHAASIARSGFTKKDIKAYIYEKARLPRRLFHERNRRGRYPEMAEDSFVKLVPSADDIMVIVVGGTGTQSSFIPTFGKTRAITRKIEEV